VTLTKAFEVNTSLRDEIVSHLDHFFIQQEIKWSRQIIGPTLTYLPYGSVGDQVSGFLGSVIIAIVTGRFLLVPRESFWFNGVAPTFATGTGQSNKREDTVMTPSSVCDHPRERRMNLDQFLALRRQRSANHSIAWTNMYCADHQLDEMERSGGLSRYLTAKHERIRVGNIGHRLFDVWLQRLGKLSQGRLISTNPLVRGALYPCVFRRILKASERVERAVTEAFRPRIGERVLPIIGIYVRAARYLTRSIQKRNDNDPFRCNEAKLHAKNFSDIWEAARMLEIKLTDANPDDKSTIHARWLFVTDSTYLKKSALETFGPNKIRISQIRPTYKTNAKHCTKMNSPPQLPYIDGNLKTPHYLSPEEQTIFELVMLSRTDALLVGQSRFSSLAVFWCRKCREVWYYTECTRSDCLPIYGVEDSLKHDDENSVGVDHVYTANIYSAGSQILVGEHVVVDKILHNRFFKQDTLLPFYF